MGFGVSEWTTQFRTDQPIESGSIDEPQQLLLADSWGYNPAEHEYTVTVGFIQLAALDVLVPASEIGNWSLYVAVRKLDQSIDLKTVEYSFLSGPFELARQQEIMVRTDQEFSETMVQTSGTVQGVIFLMRKSTPVRKPFNAKDYDANDIKWIAISNVLVRATRQFEPQ